MALAVHRDRNLILQVIVRHASALASDSRTRGCKLSWTRPKGATSPFRSKTPQKKLKYRNYKIMYSCSCTGAQSHSLGSQTEPDIDGNLSCFAKANLNCCLSLKYGCYTSLQVSGIHIWTTGRSSHQVLQPVHETPIQRYQY